LSHKLRKLEKDITDWRLELVIKELRKRPMSVSELMTSLSPSIPKSTAYRIRGHLISMGLAKHYGKHKIAWIDYSPLEEDIVNEIEDFRKEKLAEPLGREIAARVGIPPDAPKFKKAFWHAAKRTGLDTSMNMIAALNKPSFEGLEAVRAEIQGTHYKHKFDALYQYSTKLVAVRIFNGSPEQAALKTAGEFLDIQAARGLKGFIAVVIGGRRTSQRAFDDFKTFVSDVGDKLKIPTKVLLVKKQDLDTEIIEVERTAADMLGVAWKTKERIEREEEVTKKALKELNIEPPHSLVEDMLEQAHGEKDSE
jgi:hypothetical protein